MDNREPRDAPREGVFIERRMTRACKYVSDQWFPINPLILTELRSGLESGRFDNDLKPFTTELKRTSLFSPTACAK